MFPLILTVFEKLMDGFRLQIFFLSNNVFPWRWKQKVDLFSMPKFWYCSLNRWAENFNSQSRGVLGTSKSCNSHCYWSLCNCFCCVNWHPNSLNLLFHWLLDFEVVFTTLGIKWWHFHVSKNVPGWLKRLPSCVVMCFWSVPFPFRHSFQLLTQSLTWIFIPGQKTFLHPWIYLSDTKMASSWALVKQW